MKSVVTCPRLARWNPPVFSGEGMTPSPTPVGSASPSSGLPLHPVAGSSPVPPALGGERDLAQPTSMFVGESPPRKDMAGVTGLEPATSGLTGRWT